MVLFISSELLDEHYNVLLHKLGEQTPSES